jgi:zinc protease
VAERLWRELAYPANHRYHRPSSGTPETVQRFSSDDLSAFHATNFVANQAHLVIVGDVGFEAAQRQVERVLGSWRPGSIPPVEETLPKTPPPPAASVSHAMAGKTQADVVQGTTTFERNHPDYYPLAFANHILGRIYFMGRLGEKVRDEQGLAYYATSDLSAGLGSGGWTVRSGVNPANLDKALASIDTEIRRFLADGPTEVEQADGIASLLGGLPRQLETNEGVAGVLGEIEMYDLGLDYLDRYPEIIRSLTRERVTEAARTWINPDQLVTVIAGPPRA